MNLCGPMQHTTRLQLLRLPPKVTQQLRRPPPSVYTAPCESVEPKPGHGRRRASTSAAAGLLSHLAPLCLSSVLPFLSGQLDKLPTPALCWIVRACLSASITPGTPFLHHWAQTLQYRMPLASCSDVLLIITTLADLSRSQQQQAPPACTATAAAAAGEGPPLQLLLDAAYTQLLLSLPASGVAVSSVVQLLRAAVHLPLQPDQQTIDALVSPVLLELATTDGSAAGSTTSVSGSGGGSSSGGGDATITSLATWPVSTLPLIGSAADAAPAAGPSLDPAPQEAAATSSLPASHAHIPYPNPYPDQGGPQQPAAGRHASRPAAAAAGGGGWLSVQASAGPPVADLVQLLPLLVACHYPLPSAAVASILDALALSPTLPPCSLSALLQNLDACSSLGQQAPQRFTSFVFKRLQAWLEQAQEQQGRAQAQGQGLGGAGAAGTGGRGDGLMDAGDPACYLKVGRSAR